MATAQLRDIVTDADRKAVLAVGRGPGQERFVASVEQSFRDEAILRLDLHKETA